MTRFLALFFGLITVFIATGVEWFENERAFLINGISRLPIIGIPGPLALYRTNAFPVITGKFSDRIYAPVVAGAIVGHGRVIAFGHDGYFSKEILNKADGERFFINALQWTGKKDKPFAGLLRVSNDLEDFIRGKGFRVKRLTGQLTREDLKEVDLVVATVNGLSSAETRKMLIEYIENGGGAIVASLGWGWLQLNPSKTLIEDHPGNLLLQVCGIAWADGYLDTSSGYFDTSILPPALNLVDAIKFIRDADKIGANVSESILSQAAATLINVVNVLPKHEKDLYSVIERFAEDGMSIVPTDKKPLRLPKNALERIKFSHAVRMLMSAPAEQVRAHPAGLDFPGKVSADAKRIFRTLRITPRGERWHSTGLYAAAGELVTVYISENLAKRGLKLRIGCHTDKLWDKPVWQRAPELSRVFELNRIENKVSSPFGGLVYVEIPHSFFGDSIELTISNVVQAPYFKYGETSVELWKKEIRNYPAPWAEIESKYIVITLPSENIRNLDDVEEVCIFWDKVQEANARLAALKTPRHDRIVLDRQISAGYMHSGYPIMALLDQQKKIADPKELKKGNWGFFHELGHNHQSPDWTFSGTGEVTVNLFTMHAFETVCGLPRNSHPAMSTENMERRMRKYFGGNGTFDDWKSDPFLALITYYQLIEGFGWGPFYKVFAEYRTLDNSKRPRTDDKKRDMFLVMFSRAVGKNLGRFFEAWKIPVGKNTLDSIKDLPEWLPEPGFPNRYMQ